MVRAALIALAAVTATDLPLDNVSGLRLGDSEVKATALLREFGEVKRETGDHGAVDLSAGSTTATLCKGRVINISHEFGSTFHQFAIVAGEFSKVYGAPVPDVFGFDGSRPASDPRGPLSLSMSAIRVRWKQSSRFMLGYDEIGSESHAFAALNGDRSPCD